MLRRHEGHHRASAGQAHGLVESYRSDGAKRDENAACWMARWRDDVQQSRSCHIIAVAKGGKEKLLLSCAKVRASS